MPSSFSTTTLDGVVLIEPKVFGDDRGFFFESYHAEQFAEAGITARFVQANHSKSQKGVLRGLHFQTRKPQAKLVRVVRWAVYDVVADLRPDSPTYGKWEGFFLSEENKRQLFVPRGFAHGFLSLVDGTEFLYQCDDTYDPPYESGVRYDDPTLGIDWDMVAQTYGILEYSLSPKDQELPYFSALNG